MAPPSESFAVEISPPCKKKICKAIVNSRPNDYYESTLRGTEV